MAKFRYQLLIIAILILSACSTSKIKKEGKSVVAKKPNIIYILADDLGYGDVTSFNPNSKIPTVNLDKMAENGIKFTDAHTSSAVCTPTRYGILTGRYNWRSRLKSSVLGGYSKSLITPNRITVADILKNQGYSTAFIGKWHMGWDWSFENESEVKKINSLNIIQKVNYKEPIKNGPSTHGFDYTFGFCGSLDMPPYVFVENDMPTMVPTRNTVNKDAKGHWRNGPTSDDFVHETVLQDLTDRAITYIDEKAKEEKPFFLYFPLPAPHTPILPTKEFLGKSNTNKYGDFVMQVDDVVGQIREKLKDLGISENTLLVFTSDNGCSPRANFEELEKFNHDPSYVFRGMKSDIYEGGHRVPFIVEWPNKALKKTSSNQTICTTDFFATCADITNYQIKETEGEDSFSMLPLLLKNENQKIREYTVHHSIDGSFAIRQGDWKLCVAKGSAGWSYPKLSEIRKQKLDLPAMQLFNIKKDVGETKNLITKMPQKAAELKAALKKIILEGRSTEGEIQTNEGMEGWKQIKEIVK
ncbi:arylsulfatase [Polaribacter vadi]|uniref:sulfatase family protein n=1 Tax=Polaribacter TaxID=52959 RepID=UPI001C08002C|nr:MULTISPECIES: arylsulfatase [Polaribacter]MBU3011295.1 arylsulfatase [Polaribacter vadi]MDO6741108.1 arylsulfatase [Polaribacter sp. 1_MG-2023]